MNRSNVSCERTIKRKSNEEKIEFYVKIELKKKYKFRLKHVARHIRT